MTVLREMTPADVDAVTSIEAEVSAQPWSRRLFADEFAVAPPDGRRWVVALDEAGRIIGFGGLMIVGDEGHIMNVATAPDHQRQGVAQSVLRWLWDAAIGAGVEHLTLEVRLDNQPARRLYQRFGFAPVGVRAGYYEDGEDALILWVHDIEPLEVSR